MPPRRPPRLTSAIPLLREGDGPTLCRRFCRRFGAPKPGTRQGPGRPLGRMPDRVWLKDGPYLCVCVCGGFAQRKPIKIRRPRVRGQMAARRLSTEKKR